VPNRLKAINESRRNAKWAYNKCKWGRVNGIPKRLQSLIPDTLPSLYIKDSLTLSYFI
jgi:hypothetical protein